MTSAPGIRKSAASALLILVCVAAVWAVRTVRGPVRPGMPDSRFLARSKGDPSAALWIVEYADLQCGACADAALLVKRLLAAHPKEVFVQFRFKPNTGGHRYALKAAIYAECAARQGRFWDFHDSLFARQREWSASPDPDGFFLDYARAAGLDTGRLASCVDDPKTKQAVVAEKDQAIELGVVETPTFFINGRMVVGAPAFERELGELFPEPAQRTTS